MRPIKGSDVTQPSSPFIIAILAMAFGWGWMQIPFGAILAFFRKKNEAIEGVLEPRYEDLYK